MSGTKKTHIAIYVGYVVVVCLSFIDKDGLGLTGGCGLMRRVSYPLFHQNVFHALVNLWVFHQCYHSFPCRWSLLVFWLIAVSYPFAAAIPIVGLSGFVYAYMGYIAPFVERKFKYNATILFYISIGFAIPNMAIGVHIYSYVLGLLWGYLNAPLCQDK